MRAEAGCSLLLPGERVGCWGLQTAEAFLPLWAYDPTHLVSGFFSSPPVLRSFHLPLVASISCISCNFRAPGLCCSLQPFVMEGTQKGAWCSAACVQRCPTPQALPLERSGMTVLAQVHIPTVDLLPAFVFLFPETKLHTPESRSSF